MIIESGELAELFFLNVNAGRFVRNIEDAKISCIGIVGDGVVIDARTKVYVTPENIKVQLLWGDLPVKAKFKEKMLALGLGKKIEFKCRLKKEMGKVIAISLSGVELYVIPDTYK